MRVIDPEGKNLGIISLEEALRHAEETGLDLIEIAPTAKPPVARIMDFGKYQYQKEKEARESRKKIKEVEIHGIRARLGTSAHDLELKAKKAEEFLKNGDHIRVELILKGREKYLNKNFINERLDKILTAITVPHVIIDGPKRGPRGLIVTIQPKHESKNKQSGRKANQNNEIRQDTSTAPAPKPF